MQNSLFDQMGDANRRKVAPLAVRMRPTTFDDFLGQDEVVGQDTWLRRAVNADTLSSIILFGPAGTGKTSLARIIAGMSNAYFEEVSAITGTVAELRKAIAAASSRLGVQGMRTILFIDEIHRFSKSQQDALLHAVEDRTVILIGATTENPFFEVNAPLVSRSRIIELKPLATSAVVDILKRALVDEKGLDGKYPVDAGVLEDIAYMAAGDARNALMTLELVAQFAQSVNNEQATPEKAVTITRDMIEEVIPTRQLPYDKRGDNHYDVISAFIKSMRGSDPDAAVYWLAHMLAGGEDPKFIARRMMILASEDIGNADPRALLIAMAAFKATEVIGMPECRINLAQAATYLALAEKSNASYLAIDEALKEVRSGKPHFVPNHLRDRHRPGSDEYGPYRYPHNFEGAWVRQQYLPDDLTSRKFYRPTARGWEGQHDKKYPGCKKP